MNSKITVRKLLLASTAILALCAGAAQAKETLDTSADKAIVAQYAAVEKLVNAGAPVADVGHALYWPNVIVAGQGNEKTAHGYAELEPVLASVLKDLGTHCHFQVQNPTVQNGAMAAAFSQLTCKAAAGQPDINLRLLYVWERRGTQWRVVREMYTDGVMN
jgi:SnoaL-like domain